MTKKGKGCIAVLAVLLRVACTLDVVIAPLTWSPPRGKALCLPFNDEGETHQSNCYVVVPSTIGATLEEVEPELTPI